MSLLDAWVTPDRAVVIVDTTSNLDGGKLGEASKVMVLPTMSALIAGRGVYGLFAQSVRAAMEAGGNFDEMVEQVESLLVPQVQWLLGIAQERGRKDPKADVLVGNDLVIVGWSPQRRRFFGHGFRQLPGETSFQRREIDQASLMPGCPPLEADPPFDMPTDSAAMMRIAQEQVTWSNATFPHLSMGGRLLMAEATRSGTSVRAIGEFERR